MKYRLLGKSGLRVSELCLGTMAFGEDKVWGCDEKEAAHIAKCFVEQGGNFLDTSNHYAKGEGERIVGKLLSGRRDHFVIGTKFGFVDAEIGMNHVGTHRKNLRRSVEGSLQRLGTDYIDLLWIHCPDPMTPIEETLVALHELVQQGKVLYIGISNPPAWTVSRANTLAELKGWSSFVGLQIEYNLLQREAERELLPMAKELDIAITPWSPLAGGVLTGKYLRNEGKRVPDSSPKRNERSNVIVAEVVKIAEAHQVEPSQVALRWLMQQPHVVVPIVGARKAAQLQQSLGCLEFELTGEEMKKLNEISAVTLGYPHDFLKADMVTQRAFGGQLDQVKNHRDI